MSEVDANARSVKERAYSVSNEALAIFNGYGDALQIWMHAMTSPDDWVFRKKNLQECLKITRRKWDAAIKHLMENGLLEVKTIKNPDGKFFGKRYVFYSISERDKKRNLEALESIDLKSKSPKPKKNKSKLPNEMAHVAEHTELGTSAGVYIYLPGGCKGGDLPETAPSEDGMTQEEIERHRARFLSRFTGIKTFQTFDDCKEKRPGITKVFHNDTSKLEEINFYGGGIFLTVNETDGKGRRKENITRIRAIFVDLDGSPLEPALEHNPHMVVETSQGKFHCYWFVKDFPIEAFSDTQKRLAEMFNGDPVVHDTSRVMRVPGYWHQKNEAFLSRIILEGYEEPLDYSEVVAKFPPKPVKQWSKPRYTESDENSEYKGQYGTVAGNRNNGLMKFVGGMVKRRKPWDQVESEAWKWGKGCSPPLPDHEIELLLRSARRYA